jgi:hypothetical protein
MSNYCQIINEQSVNDVYNYTKLLCLLAILSCLNALVFILTLTVRV